MPSSASFSNPSFMPTSLIAGFLGEIGSALQEVLSEAYPDNLAGIDLNKESFGLGKPIDILHICFPYSERFEEYVKSYQATFSPRITIVHSTVPVGTSRKVGAIHSPIRGRHPHLKESLKIFPKFLGGEAASLVSDYFRQAGIKVILVQKPETTEAGKIFDTEYYRATIEFMHRVMDYCEANDLNFHEVYTLFNQTYNEGYTKLGYPEYVRPVLQPIKGPIGGHCVIPNSKLI